jgi:hypothetical protein
MNDGPSLLSSLSSLFQKTDEDKSSDFSAFWKLFADEESTGSAAEPKPCAVEFDPNTFFWAMRNLPIEDAVHHMATIGTIGSGKTTLIRLLLQSIAPRFLKDRTEDPEQLVIFDGKTEIVPILHGLGLTPETTNFHILNPYDQRGVGWRISDGVKEPAMAQNLASIIIPEETNSSAPYFSKSAQQLTYAAILGLNEFFHDWSLRDLIICFDSWERLLAVTAADPGRSHCPTHSSRRETFARSDFSDRQSDRRSRAARCPLAYLSPRKPLRN